MKILCHYFICVLSSVVVTNITFHFISNRNLRSDSCWFWDRKHYTGKQHKEHEMIFVVFQIFKQKSMFLILKKQSQNTYLIPLNRC